MTERLTWINHAEGYFEATHTAEIAVWVKPDGDWFPGGWEVGTETVVFEMYQAGTEAERVYGDPIDGFHWQFHFEDDGWQGDAPTFEAAKAAVEAQAMDLGMFELVTLEES